MTKVGGVSYFALNRSIKSLHRALSFFLSSLNFVYKCKRGRTRVARRYHLVQHKQKGSLLMESMSTLFYASSGRKRLHKAPYKHQQQATATLSSCSKQRHLIPCFRATGQDQPRHVLNVLEVGKLRTYLL